MKKKVIAVFIASIIVTGFLSIFLFIRREKEISLQWLTESSRSQLDLMGDLLQSEVEKLKGQMARVATLMEAGQTEEAQKSLIGLNGIAAVDPDSGSFFWKVQSSSENKDATKDEWNGQWLQKARDVGSADGDVKFFVVQNPDGEVRSAMTLLASIRDRKSGQVNKVRLIGIHNRPLFQELIDKLKAQGVHVFLTTPAGLTLAHTVSEYVGNSMVGDRTYEDIRKQKMLFGTIITKDVRGDDILSFFVKLPVGKLTLVSQWRKELWVTTDWGFYGQIFLMSLALALMFGALAQYFLKKIQEGEIREVPVEKIVERIVEKVVEKPVPAEAAKGNVNATSKDLKTKTNEPTTLNKNTFDAMPVPSRPPLLFSSPVANGENREPQVSLRVLEKVVSTLKAPLLSVLGHVQIARLNPQGGSLQAIENEVRSARDVLDRVGQYTGQAQIPSVTLPLFELVEAALRTVEGALMRGNIKIVREVPADLAVKCDIDEFKLALASIFRNSIEAMEKNLRKTLTIKASKQNGQIVFEIEDTGEGISPENVDRVFEPFFTTKSTLDHRGLGLAMAGGILRQHGAEIHIKSKVGEGTLVTLRLPVSHDVMQSLSDRAITQRALRETVKTPSMLELNQAAQSETYEKTAKDIIDEKLKPVQEPVVAKSSFVTSSVLASPSGSLGNLDFSAPEATSDVDVSTQQGDMGAQGTNEEGVIGVSEASLSPNVNEAPATEAVRVGNNWIHVAKLPAFKFDIPEEESHLPVSDPLNLFNDEDEDSFGDFQFGRMDFAENKESDKKASDLSRGEQMAAAAIQSVLTEPSSSPVKRLKKKDEPLAKMKVQIPRPEERL